MIDFHSHVLPGVDDGAKTVADSLALFRMLQSQKITDLVLTPHFYPDQQSVDRFLSNRSQSFERLSEALAGQTEIRLYPGAEVYCSEYLLVSQNLSPLCIKGTSLLLLEMPLSRQWPPDVWLIIKKLVDSHAIVPVIAHAERYPVVQRHPSKVLSQLIDSGCVIQANCDSFVHSAQQNSMLKWLDSGLIHLLGTDCHNVERRPPLMKEACDVITRELGAKALDVLEATGSRLLSGKPLRSRNLFF